ncbi:FHA domain-containing protein [Leifsonia sp. C5G2]|uniref:FHA domain-containing protein n=1 Tax=Leifsonia sp. C5G2 TaxID=2735269 RepID=UPI00158579D2|nr:FHA domain-containing protein [Leifsonia sp. C5G2]
MDTSESVVLGRHPVAVGDRKPITVESPERMLSRTHALVDVDDEGRIVVTDYHSGNGIETQTDPPRRFEAGVPYTIEPGTSLRMGDVVCTIERVER